MRPRVQCLAWKEKKNLRADFRKTWWLGLAILVLGRLRKINISSPTQFQGQPEVSKTKKQKVSRTGMKWRWRTCPNHTECPNPNPKKSDWEESARIQLLMWSLGVSSSPGITGKFLQSQVSTKRLN